MIQAKDIMTQDVKVVNTDDSVGGVIRFLGRGDYQRGGGRQ